MLAVQRKACLFDIINVSDQNEVLPSLLRSPKARQNFAKFLKIQFNSSVIQMLQIGQKKGYQQIKKRIRDVFTFCRGTEGGEFIRSFVLEEVLQAGVRSVRDFRATSTKNLIDYFQVEEKAATGLNPYLLRFVSSYLVKEEAQDLTEIKNCLSSLISLHLCMVFYFQSHQALVKKLLKSCLKLVSFCKKHGQTLAKSGELTGIAQNHLLNLATKNVNYADQSDKRFSDQQLLFLELHLAVDSLCDEAAKRHNVHVGKVLEDSEAICAVR